MTVLCLSSAVEAREGGRRKREKRGRGEGEKTSTERRQLEPKFLPSESFPAQRNPSSLQSKKEFFAGFKNTEANLSFIVGAPLQRTQVFCSLQNGVVISYFEQKGPRSKAHGLGSG